MARNYNAGRMMPGAHLVRYVLVDLRRMTRLDAYFDGMAAVADLISSDGESEAEPWDVALVSDNTGHYPLLLGYAATVRRSGMMRCEVLRDLPAAIAWLGLPPDAVTDVEKARAEDIA